MNRTKVNAKARRKIAAIAQEKQLVRCEVKLGGCMLNAHAPAHRHKRVWYYDKPDELLWNFNQWLAACQACHNILEGDAQLTARIFEQLRGQDYDQQ